MRKKNNDIRFEVIRLYNTTNFNQRLIGEKVGCSEGTIRNILKEAGVNYNPANRIGVEEAPVVKVPCISIDEVKEAVEGIEANLKHIENIIEDLKKTFIN